MGVRRMALLFFRPAAVVLFAALGVWLSAGEPPQASVAPAREHGRTSPTLSLSSLKIGFVDIDMVTEKSGYVRKLLDTLEKQIREKQDSLTRKQEEYAALRTDLERKRAVLSDDKIQEMRQRSVELGVAIENEDYAFREFLRSMERERMGPAFDRVLDAIRRLAIEEDFDLILRGDIVLFGKPTLNLTDKVIRVLDRDETGAAPPPRTEPAPPLSPAQPSTPAPASDAR